MSVTFSIEGNPTGAFTFSCEEEVFTAASYEDILVERAAHMLLCEDCQHYGCYTQPVMDVSDDFDVNLANTNARMVLSILGMTEESEDLCGSIDGEDLLGRVLVAMAEDRDDTGVASAVIGGSALGQRGATMVDCGLPAGYFAERFGALHALAAEAARLGRPVTFA